MKPRGVIVDAAIAEFGEPNWGLSSQRELRFRGRGSLSVNVSDGVWFDHEAGEGGRLRCENVAVVPKSVRLIVKKYDYVDAGGELVFQVVRYAPKDFRQRRPAPGGGWVWNLQGVELVPYRLPELIASREVVVVEGERDVEALAALGVVATCKPQGSGKWPAELSPWFAGKDVLVLADNDDAGRKFAAATAAGLAPVAQSVRWADAFSDMAPRADVSDFVEGGGDVSKLLDSVRSMPAIEAGEVEVAGDLFPTIDADAIEAVFDADDFVENLLVAGQMSVLYGPSNSGKTFFASDLAMHVALGRRWRERDVTQCSVLYVAAEGSYGIRNRVAAFRQHHGVGHLPMTIMPLAVNMYDSEEDVARLVDTVRAASKRLGGVGLVVLDTLARVMAGGEENSASDMGLVIDHVDSLARSAGVHVMLVHHSGKDSTRGARGSSALRAATATELEVEALDGMSVCRVTKQRDLEADGEFGFGLRQVELGRNARGRVVTSCVVEARDVGAVERKQRRPSGKWQRLALREMNNALIDHGRRFAIANGPTVNAVDEADWRRITFRKMSGEDRHKWTAWRRAVDFLVADEFVYRDGDMCWLVS